METYVAWFHVVGVVLMAMADIGPLAGVIKPSITVSVVYDIEGGSTVEIHGNPWNFLGFFGNFRVYGPIWAQYTRVDN